MFETHELIGSIKEICRIKIMEIYNIRRNVNSDISIVTMRRVAIIFFELGVVKNFMQIF